MRRIIEGDQWTISSAPRNQPAYHVLLNDRRGSEIYISGASGQVFQSTDRKERGLAWLGAIPHWLYPTQLRQHAQTWTAIVVWTSIAGTFLAATGMYVGIVRLRLRGRDARGASPYRGLWYWHHITGLIFGILALTWVFSGLMTMNPWGALTGSSNPDYRGQITGSSSWGDTRQFLSQAAGRLDNGEFVQLQSSPFAGNLYVHAIRADGSRVRLDAAGNPAPLQQDQLREVLERAGLSVRELTLMHAEDSYYYGHKHSVELPVFRVSLADEERTRLYISPELGTVRVLRANGRLSRWIRTGLHGLDFPILRLRPLWDVVVIALLLGVTALCAIGTLMGLRRLRRDYRVLLSGHSNL